MKITDMLTMSLKNLWQRKARTILTVLGVVIGVASIVVMISLGLGLKQSMMEETKKYSNLTTITVRTPYDSGKAGKDAEKKLLSDSTVEKFKELDHVVSVSPKLNMNATLKFGKYQVDAQLSGLPVERLQRMNINVGEGTLPQEGEDLKLFYGQYVLNSYYNPRNYVYPYYDSGQPLDWDLMARPTATYFPASSNNNSSSNSNEISGGGGGSNTTRKYLIPTAGVEASSGEYTSTSYDVYCDIDALITMVKKIYRNQAIPGQPTKKNGKPYKNIYYSEILVEVDDFQNVTDVQNLIKIMGYDAQSDVEWIKQTQQQTNMIQAVLGGIGAVSLLVAAIGIANTMMMSIYERIREIGIMKVIGCNIRDIGGMFLMEAAYIGFFGGVVGLGFSYAVSAIINHFSAGGDGLLGLGGSSDVSISQIPPWLAIVGVLFAIVIGMISGFVPSQRAMRLSALAAIKNE